MEIRSIRQREWEDAMQLAWNTFLIYEAPDYSEEGVKHFKEFVKGKDLKKMFLEGQYRAFGAFEKSLLVGILTVRNRSHISLLFVDAEWHRKGVGTALIQRLFQFERDEMGVCEVTVNAAPYAIEFYRKMGFSELEEEKLTDGIRYTPMIARLRHGLCP